MSTSPPRKAARRRPKAVRVGLTSRATTEANAGYPGKRLLDVSLAALLLLLAAPLMLLIAVAVRWNSPGPALFRQKRLGQGERPFFVLKFRSMRADAESVGPQYTTIGDPRITRIGRLLRKTSLDELPQLINVLRGEMSLVGPRPYVGFELKDWTAEQRVQRARVRPGVTGLAQVSGRSYLSPDQIRACDLDYVQRCSFWLDCRILLRTLSCVAFSRTTI